MIYHVEVITRGENRTDMTTRSFYQAARRREQFQLSTRGLAEVRTGSGRLVIDVLGNERR